MVVEVGEAAVDTAVVVGEEAEEEADGEEAVG